MAGFPYRGQEPYGALVQQYIDSGDAGATTAAVSAVEAEVTTPGSTIDVALKARYKTIVDLGAPGSDVTSIINNAVAALGSQGGHIELRGSGGYDVSSPGVAATGHVSISGSGPASVVSPTGSSGGVILRASTTNPPTSVVELSGEGNGLYDICVDGRDLASNAVKISGYSNRIVNSDIRRGLNNGVLIAADPNHNGHENNLINCLLTQNAMGVNVHILGNSSGAHDNDDNLILGCVMRGGNQQVLIEYSNANQIDSCHMYAWPNASATCNIKVYNCDDTQFVGNYFDGPSAGPMLIVAANGGPHYGTLITGNGFFNFASTFADNTYPAIQLDGTVNSVNSTAIVGNTFAGYSASRRLSFAVQALGFGASSNIFIGNTVRNSASVFQPYPAAAFGNTIDGLPVAQATQMSDPTFDAITVHVVNDAFRRFRVRGDGQIMWGSGSATADVVLARLAANVLGLGSDDSFKTGSSATGSLPAAATVGEGARFWDSTVSRSAETDGTQWRYPVLESASTRAAEFHPTGSLSHTFPRAGARVESAAMPGGSGKQHLYRVRLRKGMVVNSITFVSLGTGATSPTHQWFSLYDANLNKLAVTADDTTTAWAAGAAKTLTLSSPYTVTADGDFYVGFMVAASTVPSLACIVGSSAVAGLAPVIAGYDNTNTGLTTPSTAPATTAALTASGVQPYAYVS